MTREEKIRQAARDYVEKQTAGVLGIEKQIALCSFEAGAEYADANPKIPWHSVADGDLPKEPKGCADDMPFVVITEGDYRFLAYCDVDGVGNLEFFDDCELILNVKYWMEIPQLPKESEVSNA